MTTFTYVNGVQTTLQSPLTTTSTTAVLASSVNLPITIPAGDVLALTLRDAATLSVFEIVYATSITGATLTIERAQEGTAALAWNTGDLAFIGPTAGQMAQIPASVVTAFNTRTGGVTLSASDVGAALGYTPAPTASPQLTGTPTAPTAATGNSSTQIATTAFVAGAALPPTGYVASFNARTQAVTLSSTDVTAALGYTPAPTNSPILTGSPASTTPTAGDSSTRIATTAFVQGAVAGLQAAWPIGSVYINASSSTNPATLLGFGTWSAFAAGLVLVGIGPAPFTALGNTGGEQTHTLSVNEMPAHSHTYTTMSTTEPQSGSSTPCWFGSASANTSTVGGSGAHNNLQPYITVSMWVRTA